MARFTGSYDWLSKNRLIVVVGGAASDKTNTAEDVDFPLLAWLIKPDATVVGCESTQAASSYVSAWHKTGIATVDNADSAIGQVDLIYALNGENARFGTKEGAERLIPQTMESE